MQEAYHPPCSKSLGVSTLARGYLSWPGMYPHWLEGTYLGWGVPHLGQWGAPTLAREYPTLAGVPTLTRGTHLGQEGTYLGWGGGYLPWPRWVPPVGVNRQTPVKTVPSPILRMRVVKIQVPFFPLIFF